MRARLGLIFISEIQYTDHPQYGPFGTNQIHTWAFNLQIAWLPKLPWKKGFYPFFYPFLPSFMDLRYKLLEVIQKLMFCVVFVLFSVKYCRNLFCKEVHNNKFKHCTSNWITQWVMWFEIKYKWGLGIRGNDFGFISKHFSMSL